MELEAREGLGALAFALAIDEDARRTDLSLETYSLQTCANVSFCAAVKGTSFASAINPPFSP